MKTIPQTLLALTLAGCGGGDETGGSAPAQARPLDLIREGVWPKLVVELDAAPGVALRDGVTQRLASALATLVDKPGGVEFVLDGALPVTGADEAWTDDALHGLAIDSFDREVDADTIKLHILLVRGHSARDDGDGQVLGLAWDHTHLALFMDTVEANCTSGRPSGPAGRLLESLCAESQRAVVLHELGHLLGLVDNGLPMQADHRDADHGNHSDNPDCLMYWAYEGARVIELVRERLLAGQNAEIDFDQACLDDLAAVR